MAGRDKVEIERATAFGFFIGFGLGVLSAGDRLRDAIYTGAMAIRIGLIAIPTAAVVGLVLLLNGLDAGAGIAVAALGVIAVVSGAAPGYFADRLPELPRARRSHSLIPHHVDR